MPAEKALPWLFTGFEAEFILKLLASFPSLPGPRAVWASLGLEPGALHSARWGQRLAGCSVAVVTPGHSGHAAQGGN